MALTPADHERVSAAISAAEERTSGEIFCVFTEAADAHDVVPLAYAGLVALIVPPILLWFGLLDPTWFHFGWSTGTEADIRDVVTAHSAAAALLFASTWLIVRIPAVRYRLAPASLRQTAVHRAAMDSFLSHGIHLTDARTGILIFLSRREHQAEIVADEGIYARVDESVWVDALAALRREAAAGDIAAGFCAAIELCGHVLAEHFPPGATNPNELPDRLIEV
ncbi:MAG: TPM domain-containing protein [Pseudomonadota bacterium]